MVGAASNAYGVWNFAKNKDAAMEFLRYYAANWTDAFKASTGYNMPIFGNIVPKPFPVLSNDPTSHPADKLAVTATSDEWCAVAGYPGPAWPATDEIYNQFIINDMMTKAATGSMSAEDAVKWATQNSRPSSRNGKRRSGRRAGRGIAEPRSVLTGRPGRRSTARSPGCYLPCPPGRGRLCSYIEGFRWLR